ncbi:hypothetical protein ES288_A01G051500v1 [Gossypium darwinii]|uniref:Uncharacterized protein n=1 Tax=Gossypium darwinii TaxID=34276 RepID=A0A5D2HKP1_GOSDA|nr:hypothetical protein ES288_A01G051500v1 [Gossypium darwinii]
MARLSIVLIIFLFSFIIQAPSSAEARKLMMNLQETAEALPLNKNVFVSVKQREPTPAVSFRNKDHEIVDECCRPLSIKLENLHIKSQNPTH